MAGDPADVDPNTAVRMVDLFAGPGGLDVAARWLGVTAAGIEWDVDACETRRAAGLLTRQGDVRDFGPDDYPDATILTGGPPCQTYTVAGGGAGRRALERVLKLVKQMAAGESVATSVAELDDERTGLVLEPLRWALAAHERGRPYEAVLLEQVPSVRPVWEAVGEALEGIGYKVSCGLLHTEEFGVPQTRRRAILMARRDRKPLLPAPTHRRYRKGIPRSDGDPTLLPWVTMGETLKRQGAFTVVSNYGTGGDPKERGRRTHLEPSATVTGKISRNRLKDGMERDLPRFTASEAGRLQTFPRDYPWSGRNIAQQVGNAIPPLLAAHVLAALLERDVKRSEFEAMVNSDWMPSANSATVGDPSLAMFKPLPLQ